MRERVANARTIGSDFTKCKVESKVYNKMLIGKTNQ